MDRYTVYIDNNYNEIQWEKAANGQWVHAADVEKLLIENKEQKCEINALKEIIGKLEKIIYELEIKRDGK